MPDLFLADDGETERLGQWVAMALQPVDCITLEGALGTGKTTLARALIRTLAGANVPVVSPTFLLVQDYPIGINGTPGVLNHLDLYRLETENDLRELGLDEMLETSVVCIEWPELAASFLPRRRLAITMRHLAAGRQISLTGSGGWERQLEGLDESFKRST